MTDKQYPELPMGEAHHSIDGMTACWDVVSMRAYADTTYELRTKGKHVSSLDAETLDLMRRAASPESDEYLTAIGLRNAVRAAMVALTK